MMPMVRQCRPTDAFGVAWVALALVVLLASKCQSDPIPIVEPAVAAGYWDPGRVDVDSLVAWVLAGSPDEFGEPSEDLRRLGRHVRFTSWRYRVDPFLIARLIHIESRAQPTALGPPIRVRANGRVISTRAVGLGQIVPELWLGVFPECGDDLLDPRDNICYTVLVYRWYQDRHPGDTKQALLSYNGCRPGWSCDWYADAITDY